MEKLKSSAPTMERQIRNFSKVWRMPDLTSEKNKEVLELALHEAGIDTGTCTCIYIYERNTKYCPCVCRYALNCNILFTKQMRILQRLRLPEQLV